MPALAVAILTILSTGTYAAPGGPYKPVINHQRQSNSALITPNFGWISFSNCIPQTVQFIDSSTASGATIQQWLWDFGDGSSSTDQEPLHDYKSNGDFVVKLTIIDDAGDTAAINKTFSIDASVPFVEIGNDTTVCGGTILSLDAGVHPGCTYYWSTGESTQTIQVTTGGYYFVQVYNNTCSAMDELYVTVKPPLSSQFAYNSSGTCLPVTIQFTDQSVSCSDNIVSWKWNFGDGDSSAQQSPSHIYTIAGSYTVSLTVKDITNAIQTTTKTVTVTGGHLQFSLGSDTSICSGTVLTLNPNLSADSYLWNDGSSNPVLDVSTAGQYWVELTKNGCTGRDSIVLKITNSLLSNITYATPQKCLPVTVHFSDNSRVICGNTSIKFWQWDFGDGSGSILQNPEHVYQHAGKFTVQLTVRDSLGSTNTTSSDVTIETTGPVFIPHTSVTICPGGTVQLDAGNPGAGFLWTPLNGVSDASIQNPLASPTITTVYQVTTTICGTSITDSYTVYVQNILKPTITQTDPYTLVASSGSSYQWYKDGVLLKKGTTKSIKPIVVGNYQVRIYNGNGCSSISDNYFFLPHGGHLLTGSGVKVKLSPNPTRDKLSILLSIVPTSTINVFIYDMLGNKVYEGKIVSNINNIDVSNLHKGQYSVQVVLGNEKITLPLLIM